eukprot:355158-Chlamydomonas_euryale.AAC.7
MVARHVPHGTVARRALRMARRVGRLAGEVHVMRCCRRRAKLPMLSCLKHQVARQKQFHTVAEAVFFTQRQFHTEAVSHRGWQKPGRCNATATQRLPCVNVKRGGTWCVLYPNGVAYGSVAARLRLRVLQ